MKGETMFVNTGLSQIPRLLGLLDANPDSRTFGCFDRQFWHYKLMDFANARYQEGALALALIYSITDASNRYHKSEKIRKWVFAAIGFWEHNRHMDGSTDENYPFERHFCSTAFSCFAVTESILLMKVENKISLEKTGDFLIRHNNKDVANQMVACASALYNIYLLTGNEAYLRGCEAKLRLFFSMQDKTGFFTEYNGFDLGYDSISLSFLGTLYKKTGREDIRHAALKCIDHMEPFIDSEGYYNPELMSRKTQFLYPYGFVVFGSDIISRIETGLEKDAILNPAWMDDRYCIPFCINYLMAAAEKGTL